jgi:hypothetical protein
MTPGKRISAALERLGTDPDGALADLAPLYAVAVDFEDPFQRRHGREAFLAATRRLLERSRRFEMRVVELVELGDQLFLRWTMRYALRFVGPEVEIAGTTHIVLEGGLVRRQRDFWDPLGSLAGAIPGVGRVYRFLLERLS